MVRPRSEWSDRLRRPCTIAAGFSVTIPHQSILLCLYENYVFVPDKKDCWAQTHDMLIDDDPWGQIKFVLLFKVIVLNLQMIMIKPEIKPGLHIVVRVAEHACDHASQEDFNALHKLQIFSVRDQYL